MKKIGIIRISAEEIKYIKAVLKNDIRRYFEISSREESIKLMDHWDGIFVRWLRSFYRPLGFEVEHKPKNKKTIFFSKLPIEHRIKSPKPLVKIEFDQFHNFIKNNNREGLIDFYVEKRLEQLEAVAD